MFVLEIILTFLFAVHLLAVNVGIAGPLVCVFLHRRYSLRNDQAAGLIGRNFAPATVTLLSFGVMIGLGMLGIMRWTGDQRYFDALWEMDTTHDLGRYWYALGELGFSFVCMAIYMILWDKARPHTNWHALLAIAASVNLLYHFPPLLSTIALISVRPEDAAWLVQPPLLKDPDVLSRSVHVWLASFAVSGVFLMYVGIKLVQDPIHSFAAPRLVQWGARLAIIPTFFQLFVGIWTLTNLAPGQREQMMGGDGLATGLFAAGLVTTLAMMHYLAPVAFGEPNRRPAVRAMWLMVLTVAFMSASLRRARLEAEPAEPPRHEDYEDYDEFDSAASRNAAAFARLEKRL